MLGRRAWSKRCPLLQRAPRPVGELVLEVLRQMSVQMLYKPGAGPRLRGSRGKAQDASGG